MINSVCLAGRIATPLEIKITSTNKRVLNFRLAVKENKDITYFHDITVWENQAEFLSKNASIGDLIFVSGKLVKSEYEKNGEKRYDTKVIANGIEIASSKNKKSEYEFQAEVKPEPSLESNLDLEGVSFW